MGLAPRFDLTTAESGDNIILGDGSGSDNTSIWLVVWGPNTCHGIYPKGSQAGLKHDDLGEVTLEDAAGDNIILGDGSGSDNTSIWLVVWGPNTCHGIYPKGSQAGLKHEDLGEVTLEDAASGKYQGYRTHYKWDIGLTLRDWRYVVRIPNIDISNLTADASSGADLVDLMVQAIEKIPNLGLGRPVFYGNRTISSYLRRHITNANNVRISMDEVAGKRVLNFDGIPFRRNDAITNAETLIS